MITRLRKLFDRFKELMIAKILAHEMIENDGTLKYINSKKIDTMFFV